MSECYADMAGVDCNCPMCEYLVTPEAKDAIRVGKIVAEQHEKIKALELRVHQFDQAIRRIGHHVGACCAGVDVMDDNGLGSHTDQEIIRKIDKGTKELEEELEAEIVYRERLGYKLQAAEARIKELEKENGK